MSRNKYPPLTSIRKKMLAAAEQSGLSYTQIGLAMGRKESTARKIVQQMLTDQSVKFNPRLETLLEFAKAVKKPLEYFF